MSVKISQLPSTTSVSGPELVPLVQGGVTKYITVANFLPVASTVNASAVVYDPAGTGATATTAQAKLRESVSVLDFGAVLNGVANDTTPVTNAIASQTSAGGKVYIPPGTALLNTSINAANWVNIYGANKRASRLKANTGFVNTQVVSVVNGTSASFDNALMNLTVDCNNIVGLNGVVADSWQEGGGLRDVLVQNFATAYGVLIQTGYGGATTCHISDTEVFGSAVTAGTGGIRCNTIGATGGFALNVTNTTIAGGGTTKKLTYGIYMVNDSLFCEAVHFEDTTSGIYVDGAGDIVLVNVTGGPGVTTLIEIASTFTGTLRTLGCKKLDATNFIVDNRSGGMGTLTTDGDLFVRTKPTRSPGEVNSCGYFDGSVASPSASTCFNVASITKVGTGIYTITESVGRVDVGASVWAISNFAAGRCMVELIGSTSYKIYHYNSTGTAADANEIKFGCVRIK